MDKSRRNVLRQLSFLTTTTVSVALFPAMRVHAQATGNYVRSRTTPLPTVVKTQEELSGAKLVLPYSKSAVRMRGGGGLPSYKYTPGAYESVGLQKYMGSTGERQEIGLVSEAQAIWMTGGSPNNMLVQAAAHGSIPIHATLDGRVVNHFKYPRASFDSRQSPDPYFDISNPANPIQPDMAHYPALTYVAYLATGDQYYLEELQFAATWHIIGGPINYARGKGLIFPWQQRQLAWGLRDIIGAFIATQEAEKQRGTLPAPLLPSSYWKQIIDNNVTFLLKRYTENAREWEPKGPRPMSDVGFALVKDMGFIGCDDLNYIAPWQQDFLSTVLGWAVWTGRVPQVKPLYDFQIRQAIKRATGPLRSQAVQYNLPKGAAETWAASLVRNGRGPMADGHYDRAIVGPVADYPAYLRGALKVAVMNGVKGAEEAFAYADAEAKRFGVISTRWAI